MKQYLLTKKADSIRKQANRLEGLINSILVLANETNIEVTDHEKNSLTKGHVKSVGAKALLAQSATRALFESADRSGNDTTKLEENARKIGYLLDALKTFESQKQMPGIWEDLKISSLKLNALIEKECTIELTKQQEAEIELIEQTAKVSRRFNPMEFVENGKALIEDYLSFTNL